MANIDDEDEEEEDKEQESEEAEPPKRKMIATLKVKRLVCSFTLSLEVRAAFLISVAAVGVSLLFTLNNFINVAKLV